MRSRAPFGRIARRKAASKASACFCRSMWTCSHSNVTTPETVEATAALATPSIGSPSQPRISAGVTTRPVMVETVSATSGVTVSPTPRIIAVSSRNAKVMGMLTIMIRA